MMRYLTFPKPRGFIISMGTGVVAMIAAVVCGGSAFAACGQAGTMPTVTISGGASSGFEWDITENCVTERWDVVIRSVFPATFTPTATIAGDATTKLGVVTAQRVVTFFPAMPNDLTFGGPFSISIGTSTVAVDSVIEVRKSFVDLYRGCVPLDPIGTNPCPEKTPPAWYIDITSLRVVRDWGSPGSNAATDIRKIEDVLVGGDVLGAVMQDISDTNSIASSIEILGNLRASWSTRRLESITVANRIGIDDTKTDDVVIDAIDGIGEIEAGSLFATVWSGGRDDVNGNPGVRKPIDRIEINGEASSPFIGEVHGRISMSRLGSSGFPNAEISILESLVGTISLTEPLTNPIFIDQALGFGARIELPEDGLQSQIVVNAGGDTTNPSTYWKSGAKVVIKDSAGDIEITAPAYTQLPTQLAGQGNDGAIGLAPYELHGTASTPPHLGQLFVTGLDMGGGLDECIDLYPPVLVRMYGPVNLIGSAPHFSLSIATSSSGPFAPTSITLSSEVVSGTGNRTVRLRLPNGMNWQTGYYYLIEPIAGMVTCDEVAGEPNVDSFEYKFEALDGCGLALLNAYNQNGDNTLCPADIAAWVANPVDLNNDSAADEADCTRLINAIQLYSSVNP